MAPTPKRGLWRRLIGGGGAPARIDADDLIDRLVADAAKCADARLLAEVQRLSAIHEDHPDHLLLLGGGTGRFGDLSGTAADLEHLAGVSAAGSCGRLFAHTTHFLKRAVGHTQARLDDGDLTNDESAQERERLRRLRAWQSGAQQIITQAERDRTRTVLGGEAAELGELIAASVRRAEQAGEGAHAAHINQVVQRRVAAGDRTLARAHAWLATRSTASNASSGVSGRRPI